MNFKRIGRLLVCLVLICALLIQSSPIKARADVVSGGLIAAGATGAVVSVPVAIAVGATLICLGVMADVVSQDPFALQQVASEIEQHLTAAGTFVKNGMVEMYRFVTETGEAVYYAAADFMESCRSYLFDSGVVTDSLVAGNSFTVSFDGMTYDIIGTDGLQFSLAAFRDLTYSDKTNCRYRLCAVSSTASGTILINGQAKTLHNNKAIIANTSSKYLINGFTNCSVPIFEYWVTDFDFGSITVPLDGIAFGKLLNFPIDGTSARTWSEAYANRGLYIASGGSQNPDDGAEGNDGWKFLLPLALLTGADLWAMTQADQWTGSTPPEFGDYSTQEELTVTPAPEFDGYPAIEIAPVPNTNPDPGTGTDPGTGSDPDTGGESAELNWWERFTKWFLDLRTSINELPNKFDEHFENLNNNIQEVPNKFETWIQNVQTSVDAVAESILGTADLINAAISNLPNTFLGHVQNILSAIAAVPQAIVSGIKNVLIELFVPDPEYLPNKVQALVQEFGYLEPIIALGDTFKAYFTGVSPTPPVIWIDLGASAWYPMGGRVKFIDLTWYAQYKPTVDGIIGAFLWLWFLWRLLQAAPGIIQGSSGFFGNPDPHPDSSFNAPNWPTGQRLLQSGSFYHSRGSGDKHKFNE